MLYPGLVRDALLLRPVPVLSDPPDVDLAGTRIRILTGADDPAAGEASDLAAQLQARGAEVELLNRRGRSHLVDCRCQRLGGLVRLNEAGGIRDPLRLGLCGVLFQWKGLSLSSMTAFQAASDTAIQ